MSSKKKRTNTQKKNPPDSQEVLGGYRHLLSQEDYEQLKSEMMQPLPTAIRINLLRHPAEGFTEQLKKWYEWQFTPLPFCPSGWQVEANQPLPSQTIEHRMGDFYIQEAASMLPAELFDFPQGERPLILDMAASPGGKTIHLADLSQDCGLIIANDASRARLPALQVVLRKWGAINQATTALPGELFAQAARERFDLVLLDAPCSMEGLRSNASHPMRSISNSERERLAQRQRKLLESALAAVKAGGQVVYSTCTLAPQEDEAVLAAILEKFPNDIRIDHLQKKLPRPAPGLEQFGEIKFPAQMRNTLRLWPHLYHTAGFFAARITKLNSFSHQTHKQILRPKPKTFKRLQDKNVKKITNQFLDQYGFDLYSLMEKQDLSLAQIKNTLWLIPNLVLNQFNDLPLISCGLTLGEQGEHELLPGHEFSARFGLLFQRGRIQLDEEYAVQWLRGEDLRGYSVPDVPKGKVVIVTDSRGRNLGRGKVLTSQLKNLLPNRLF